MIAYFQVLFKHLSTYWKCDRWYAQLFVVFPMSHLFVAFPVSHSVINPSRFFIVAMATYFRGRMNNEKKMSREFIFAREIAWILRLFFPATICSQFIEKFDSCDFFNSLWKNISFLLFLPERFKFLSNPQ